MVAIIEKTINIYTCQKCGKRTVTKVIDEGVTPFIMPCGKCKDGEALSCFFMCPQDLKPEYEWFRPKTDAEIRKQLKWEINTFHKKEDAPDELIDICFEATKEHVKKGGLLLRDLSDGL